MKLSQIRKILDCQLIAPKSHAEADIDINIQFAYASDLMSDILVSVKPGALLLTGLTNIQVVRTGKIAATGAIIFVRNKKPSTESINLACLYKIPILTTRKSMFDACGLLFSCGIQGVSPSNEPH